jgi:hypothetical protein
MCTRCDAFFVFVLISDFIYFSAVLFCQEERELNSVYMHAMKGPPFKQLFCAANIALCAELLSAVWHLTGILCTGLCIDGNSICDRRATEIEYEMQIF